MSTVLILVDFSGDHASKTTAELATAAARIGSVSAVVLAPAGKGAALAATPALAGNFFTADLLSRLKKSTAASSWPFFRAC